MSDEQNDDLGAELVPQPHGGALRKGGKPGNKGGGRPSIRAKEVAGETMESAMRRLKEAVEGRIEVELVGTCPGCGHEGPGESYNVRGYLAEIMRIVDKIAPHQMTYGQPVDDVLVERLGNVLKFALSQAVREDALSADREVKILEYVEEAWNRIIAETNERAQQ